MTVALPDRDEAVAIMRDHDLTTLARDGWAFMEAEHPDLADLFKAMVAADKINAANLTGAWLMIGLMLQTPYRQ